MDHVDYDAADAQVLALADSLSDADDAEVAAEVARLKVLAEQIPDEADRRLAVIRVEKLPELIRGPQPGTSPQFQRAASLVAQVVNDERSAAEQIEHAERVIPEIGTLAREAPPREFRTILRMNSTLKRLIELRRDEAPDSGS